MNHEQTPKKPKQKYVKTPPTVKKIFSEKIFPTSQNKTPAVPKGTNWQKWSGDEDTITLAGLNLWLAKMVCVDLIHTKKTLKNQKKHKTFIEQ